MEQIIPFKKDIVFKSKLTEITSISLEHTLKLETEDEVSGEFIISGTYKMSEVSPDENFDYKIPFDIVLDNRYEVNDLTIDIDDFYYEIIDDEVLRLNIEVYIGGDEKKEEVIEVNVDNTNDEVNEIRNEEIVEMKEDRITVSTDNNDELVHADELFKDAMQTNDENFVSYHVHILRDGENLETITLKYAVSLDDLAQYNDLNNMITGSKLIIPSNVNN